MLCFLLTQIVEFITHVHHSLKRKERIYLPLLNLSKDNSEGKCSAFWDANFKVTSLYSNAIWGVGWGQWKWVLLQLQEGQTRPLYLSLPFCFYDIPADLEVQIWKWQIFSTNRISSCNRGGTCTNEYKSPCTCQDLARARRGQKINLPPSTPPGIELW